MLLEDLEATEKTSKLREVREEGIISGIKPWI